MKSINASINTVNGKVIFTIGGNKEKNVSVSDADFNSLKMLSMSNYDQEDGSQEIAFSHEEFDMKDSVVIFKNLSSMIEGLNEEGEF